MRDDPATDASTGRRSRRAVLGLTAGALAGVAGCIDLGGRTGDGEPSPTGSTPTTTDGPTPTGTGPEESPTPVAPENLRIADTSVQSSALARHVMGGFLDLRTSDGWLVYVTIGTGEGQPPAGNSVAHQRPPGYPSRDALRLSVQAGDVVKTYEESRRRNYQLVGEAGGAWTVFELPAGIDPDGATLEWPAVDQTLGDLPEDALTHLARDPPAFTLESFVAGEPGTTPGPTPHQSPTPDHDDVPTTTVDYELVVRNEGGAGTFRGFLDHETPKEQFIADYSQGGTRLATDFAAGEERPLTGTYTVYHREEQATVEVRAETAGGSATSRAATDD